jgi:hypothetical protein
MDVNKKSEVTFNVGPGQDYEAFNADVLEHMFVCAANNGIKKNGSVCVNLFGGEYTVSQPLSFSNNKYTLHIKSYGSVTIRGENTYIFELKSNSLILEGVRILDASGDCGGVMYATKKSKLVLKNCEFLHNSAKTGGVIFAENSDVLIQDCVFKENSAENAGVIYMGGGNIEIKDTQFADNRAEKSHAVIKLQDKCSARFVVTQILNNSAGHYYGGISALNGCEIYMDECSLRGNIAGGDVAGIFAAQRCTVTVNDTSIQNNTAENSTAMLIADKSKLTMYDSSICSNTAKKSCAGIMAAVGSSISVNDCEICENSAQDAGAISLHPDCTITLCSSLVTGNRAENNIGAIGASGKLIIKDCLIKNNTAMSQAGGILVGDQARVDINGCTILDNCAGLGLNILLVPDGSLKINRQPILFNVNTPVTPQTVF